MDVITYTGWVAMQVGRQVLNGVDRDSQRARDAREAGAKGDQSNLKRCRTRRNSSRDPYCTVGAVKSEGKRGNGATGAKADGRTGTRAGTGTGTGI